MMTRARNKALHKKILRLQLLVVLASMPAAAFAFDSYRYLHVTIETPWLIFLFLLPIVISPFILMVILYWRFAGSKAEGQEQEKE